jgi:hypothetical protein
MGQVVTREERWFYHWPLNAIVVRIDDELQAALKPSAYEGQPMEA